MTSIKQNISDNHQYGSKANKEQNGRQPDLNEPRSLQMRKSSSSKEQERAPQLTMTMLSAAITALTISE
ncbi:hypothetical protein FGO68_gene4816 [Halteria grandinella]|uniref:Uncharacterized protein n=1 Tax=Halteria grandinella TaxID=5974 RepID=A0A8J8NUK4_HALGN|nr:hypothetical protein FGO68_gene4816 [Halteria grandinella]